MCTQVYEAWSDMAPTCPQLYLYSDADPLVPPSYVEAYMAVQVRASLCSLRGLCGARCQCCAARCEGPLRHDASAALRHVMCVFHS